MGTRLPRTPAPLNLVGHPWPGDTPLCPQYPVCALGAPPTSHRDFNPGADCPGSREIYFWLVPGKQSLAKVTCQTPSFPPLNCLPALSQTLLLHLFFPLIKAAVPSASSTTSTGCHWVTGPPDYWTTRLIPASKSAGFSSLHKTCRSFCKPGSPFHQIVIYLTQWENNLGFPFPISWFRRASWGPSGGEKQ